MTVNGTDLAELDSVHPLFDTQLAQACSAIKCFRLAIVPPNTPMEEAGHVVVCALLFLSLDGLFNPV